MNHDTFDERGSSGPRQIIAAAVIAGIVLFIAGFAMTVFSLPGDAIAGTDSSDAVDAYQSDTSSYPPVGILLVAGLTLSMVGVTVATVVPAFVFIKRANRDA